MTRSSWASEPWWARATSIGASTFDAEPFPECSVAGSSDSGSSLASSFSRLARRSAPRRLLTKMIVELCSWTSFSSSG